MQVRLRKTGCKAILARSSLVLGKHPNLRWGRASFSIQKSKYMESYGKLIFLNVHTDNVKYNDVKILQQLWGSQTIVEKFFFKNYHNLLKGLYRTY